MQSQRDPEQEHFTDPDGNFVQWDRFEEELWDYCKRPVLQVFRVACTCEPWAHWMKVDGSYMLHLHHMDECRYEMFESRGLN